MFLKSVLMSRNTRDVIKIVLNLKKPLQIYNKKRNTMILNFVYVLNHNLVLIQTYLDLPSSQLCTFEK